MVFKSIYFLANTSWPIIKLCLRKNLVASVHWSLIKGTGSLRWAQHATTLITSRCHCHKNSLTLICDTGYQLCWCSRYLCQGIAWFNGKKQEFWCETHLITSQIILLLLLLLLLDEWLTLTFLLHTGVLWVCCRAREWALRTGNGSQSNPVNLMRLFSLWFGYHFKCLLLLQVAHLPDKANNYLTPALSVLEKNTWDHRLQQYRSLL